MPIERIISDVPAPLEVPLSHAVRAGDFVFIAGQIAVRADGTQVKGDFKEETRAVLDNVKAAVESAGGSLSDISKTTVFLLNARLFDPMNEVYREYFAQPFPARSTIVAPLSDPDLRIEIEAIAYIPQNR